jgi:hypothetical protein
MTMRTVPIQTTMTTIEIVPEVTSEQTLYRAICGSQQATGSTPGQALDQMEQVLATQKEAQSSETLVIVQRFRPDNLFTEQQQTRLQELMGQFHEGIATGDPLSPPQQEELESLVEAELEATIERAARMGATNSAPSTVASV